jgi:tetratricopeptide (TPR) repeat protein
MRLLALAFVLVAGAAFAEDSANKDEARAHFKQGARLIQAGDYDRALAQFLEAYRLFPNERLHYDIAQAYRLKGDRRAAIEHYRKYLAAVTTGDTARDAQSQLSQLLAEEGSAPDAAESDPKLARAATSTAPPPKIEEPPKTIEPPKTSESLKAFQPPKTSESLKTEQEVKAGSAPSEPREAFLRFDGRSPERPLSHRPWLWATVGGVALGIVAVGLGVGLGTGTRYPSPSIGKIIIPGR